VILTTTQRDGEAIIGLNVHKLGTYHATKNIDINIHGKPSRMLHAFPYGQIVFARAWVN